MDNQDYAIFCPVVNRFDLLDAAVASTAPYNMTVIDNSNGKLGDRYKGAEHVTVYIPSVPLTFQQTSNLECWLAKQRGAKYYVHMHSDAQFPTERIGELLDIARRADGKRWLVIFTLYDILCVYNVAAMEDQMVPGRRELRRSRYVCRRHALLRPTHTLKDDVPQFQNGCRRKERIPRKVS